MYRRFTWQLSRIPQRIIWLAHVPHARLYTNAICVFVRGSLAHALVCNTHARTFAFQYPRLRLPLAYITFLLRIHMKHRVLNKLPQLLRKFTITYTLLIQLLLYRWTPHSMETLKVIRLSKVINLQLKRFNTYWLHNLISPLNHAIINKNCTCFCL